MTQVVNFLPAIMVLGPLSVLFSFAPEDLKGQVSQLRDELRWQHAAREELQARLEKSTTKFRDDLENQNRRALDVEKALEERNGEIKLLMYRVQELSSKYTPAKGDV